MIAVVIIFAFTVGYYLVEFQNFRRTVVDYIIRCNDYENTFNYVEEATSKPDFETVDVYTHFYEIHVSPETLKDYYDKLIEEYNTLEAIYKSITENALFTVDNELDELLCQLNGKCTQIRYQVRIRQMKCE